LISPPVTAPPWRCAEKDVRRVTQQRRAASSSRVAGEQAYLAALQKAGDRRGDARRWSSSGANEPGRNGRGAERPAGFLALPPARRSALRQDDPQGIEYGLMAAHTEGHPEERRTRAPDGCRDAAAQKPRVPSARNEAPRDRRGLWRRGSVIGSSLLELTASALQKDPQFAAYGGRVSDSGEARWRFEAAIDEAVPANALGGALDDRFLSRGEGDLTHQVLSAMRHEFGGHLEKRVEDDR
jgi:6-phosphogluconate dehydrogenase